MQTQLLAGWGPSRVIKTDSLIRPPCNIIAREHSVIIMTVNDFFQSSELNQKSPLRYHVKPSCCASQRNSGSQLADAFHDPMSLGSRGMLLTRASLFFLSQPDQHNLYTRKEFPSKWGLQFPRVKFRKIRSICCQFLYSANKCGYHCVVIYEQKSVIGKRRVSAHCQPGRTEHPSALKQKRGIAQWFLCGFTRS